MNISVIIPSIRDTSLNEKCLSKQTFADFEVIIQRPSRPLPEGNFYDLNHDYNLAIKKSKGELIISYQDQIQIPPDTLSRFWEHYKMKPNAIVGAVGDQYATLDPPVKVWVDPRKRTDQGTFYECNENDVEYSLCSIPRKALFDVGGFDEDNYDRGAAVGEKELNARMYKAGYKFYLDQSIIYKAIKHPRMTEDWDKYYQIASELYSKHLMEIENGTREPIDFLR
jgi:hypothetical protein